MTLLQQVVWSVDYPARWTGLDGWSFGAILSASLAACLALFFFRSKGRPIGAIYWLVCLLPCLVGALWGLCRYDLAVYWWAATTRYSDGGIELGRAGSKFATAGISTVTYGLMMSCLLFLAVFYFLARDLAGHSKAGTRPQEA